MEEMAVSTISIPASAAFRMVLVLIPVVAWLCMAIGMLQVPFNRLTRASAT
jgi:hypothetical protein